MGSLFGDIVQGVGSILGGQADSQAAQRGAQATAHQYQTLAMPGFGTIGVNSGLQNFNPQLQDILYNSAQSAANTYYNPNVYMAGNNAMWQGAQTLGGAYNNAYNSNSFLPALGKFNQGVGDLSQMGAGMMEQYGQRNGGADLSSIIAALQNSGSFQNQAGQKLVNNSNFQSLANDRLALLRQQANPYERMQRNSLNDELFATGNGYSKAGAMRQGQLDLAQSSADIERQLNAQTMADQMRQFNIGAGMNMMQGGTSAYGGATNAYGVGANTDANMGQLKNQLFNMLSDQNYNGLVGRLGAIGQENSRGQTRLKNAQDIFGFGQDLQKNQAGLASAYMKPYQDIQSIIRNSYNVSAAPGGMNNGTKVFNPTMSGSEMGMAGIGDILNIPGLGDAIGDIFGFKS